jgi:hypothetical protein
MVIIGSGIYLIYLFKFESIEKSSESKIGFE